ncbi:esterase/lipase family protein [Nocardia rhamnosiphila]
MMVRMPDGSDEWEFPDAEADAVVERPRKPLSFPEALRVSTALTEDAVVVIPGIMGSELIDTDTGKRLWGLRPALLARMWTAPTASLAPLALDRGKPSKVQPGRLLRFPALMPGLGSVEPYTRLLRGLRTVVRHPDAVYEFGYDWRLPVSENATLLAAAIEEHVTWWRAVSDRPRARVHLVAHSMGGLLCQALSATARAYTDVAQVITLGTPFEGAAKAAMILSSGHGAPVPSRGLQPIAVTMPGIYDLLPSYRCIDDGTDVRRLTASDVADIGGDHDLASEAITRAAERRSAVMPSHRALIGVAQPTMCSLTVEAGRPEPRFYTFEVDVNGELSRNADGVLVRLPGLGDGTVPRNSAVPWNERDTAPLPQQHGAVAQTDEAIAFVVDRLLHRDTGPRLGQGDVGITAPDTVKVGTEFIVEVSGTDDPNDVGTVVFDTDNGDQIDAPRARRREGRVIVPVTLWRPGLFRIAVTGGSTSPVMLLVLAVSSMEVG